MAGDERVSRFAQARRRLKEARMSAVAQRADVQAEDDRPVEPIAPEGPLEPSTTLQYVAFEGRTLRKTVITVLILFVLLQVAMWAFSEVGHFLFLILLAWLIAIAMEPSISWFTRRGMRRGLGAGVTLLGIIIAFIAAIAVFGGLFFSQLAQLVIEIPTIVAQFTEWLNRTFTLDLDPNFIINQFNLNTEALTNVASNLASGLFGVLGTLFSVLFDFLTVLVFAFYIAADGPRLRRTIGSWLPPRQQRVFVRVWEISLDKTGGFVVSKVLLALVSAAAHTIFFWIIGVPYWLPMGIFAGVVSQFIPTIGTYLGIIVPAIFAMFEEPIDVIWIVIFATIYQQIENYVLTPRISRATMDIHPALALGAVFIGAAFFGPIGAIIGIPLAAAVLAVIDAYGKRYELVPELSQLPTGKRSAPATPPET